MSGLSDYSSKAFLNWLAGGAATPSLPAVYLALFTAVGVDAGTGFTEVSGGSYARVQVAGAVTAAGAISTGAATVTMPNVSGYPWVAPGMNVYDATNSKQIGTVLSWVGTTLTLTGNASNNGSGSTDSLIFSAFSPASGSAPSSNTNGAAITFPQATGSWGTAIAFGLYDASSSGNLLHWDYLGNYSWLPATVSSASPGILTVKGHGYSAADPIVFSTEFGGTAPSFSQSNFTGVLAVVSPATDSFSVTNASTAVNTSSTGSGMVRKILQQSIPSGITASFAASAFTLTLA